MKRALLPVLILLIVISGCAQREVEIPAPAETASPPSATEAPTTAPPLKTDAPVTTAPPKTEAPVKTGTPAVDPEIQVEVYDLEKAYPGTTFLADGHDPERPRIIEVDLQGHIVWEYVVPEALRPEGPISTEAELLPNGNVLFLIAGRGLYEINRGGEVVWSHPDPRSSHDADRLPNGNTIYVYGDEDKKTDAQVKEVNPNGEVVWSWYAKDHFDMAPYSAIYKNGWTHTNSVSRLPNGNTLISMRNFNFIVEVDLDGEVVRTIGEGTFTKQHDPEVQPDGRILVADHGDPQGAIEVDPETGEVAWRYVDGDEKNWPLRDANRLPNGNTLITGLTKVFEVTPEGETVWRLELKGVKFADINEAKRFGFYKADRVSADPQYSSHTSWKYFASWSQDGQRSGGAVPLCT